MHAYPDVWTSTQNIMYTLRSRLKTESSTMILSWILANRVVTTNEMTQKRGPGRRSSAVDVLLGAIYEIVARQEAKLSPLSSR